MFWGEKGNKEMIAPDRCKIYCLCKQKKRRWPTPDTEPIPCQFDKWNCQVLIKKYKIVFKIR